MRRDTEAGDAEVVVKAGRSDNGPHIDLWIDSPYVDQPSFIVRFTRREFAGVLWHAWVVLIRLL